MRARPRDGHEGGRETRPVAPHACREGMMRPFSAQKMDARPRGGTSVRGREQRAQAALRRRGAMRALPIRALSVVR